MGINQLVQAQAPKVLITRNIGTDKGFNNQTIRTATLHVGSPISTFGHYRVGEGVKEAIDQAEVYKGLYVGSTKDYASNLIIINLKGTGICEKYVTYIECKNGSLYDPDEARRDYVIVYALSKIWGALPSKLKDQFKGAVDFDAIKGVFEKEKIKENPKYKKKYKACDLKIRSKEEMKAKELEKDKRFEDDSNHLTVDRSSKFVLKALCGEDWDEISQKELCKNIQEWSNEGKLDDALYLIRKIESFTDEAFQAYKTKAHSFKIKPKYSDPLHNSLPLNEIQLLNPEPPKDEMLFFINQDWHKALDPDNQDKIFYMPSHVFGIAEIDKEALQSLKGILDSYLGAEANVDDSSFAESLKTFAQKQQGMNQECL